MNTQTFKDQDEIRNANKILLAMLMSGNVYFCTSHEVAEKFKEFGEVLDKTKEAGFYKLKIDSRRFTVKYVLLKMGEELDAEKARQLSKLNSEKDLSSNNETENFSQEKK